RHRHTCLDDAALLHRLPHFLDPLPDDLLGPRHPPRPPGTVHLSLNTEINMQEDRDEEREIETEREEHESEEVEHPAPGIEHHREPDAENLIPVKDKPGTL